MHIFFSGIGGAGIGPLALIAKQAGYTVSGSDEKESLYTHYLQTKGVQLYIGQSGVALQERHTAEPIDWFVHSSAVLPSNEEYITATELGIRVSKRDEFLSHFLDEHHLKLIAAAGTHGKTTTTAMLIWVTQQLAISQSYSVGAKLSFGDMGKFDADGTFFMYECDEFDKNFLSFSPYIAILAKVDWDHHEHYPTRRSYIEAFRQFCTQSEHIVAHAEEVDYLRLHHFKNIHIVPSDTVSQITLAGNHNKRNAAAVVTALHLAYGTPAVDLVNIINSFPGTSRRFEKLDANMYTDYAHTPEEIAATLQLAREVAKNDTIVAIYEPLTNRRQHYMKNAYKDVFSDLHALYWLPSYLAREDPDERIITPAEFIKDLPKSAHARTAKKDSELWQLIRQYSNNGKIVVLLAGGGGNSLDEWARAQLKNSS